MPDQKISQLTAGGAAQATDLLPVARGATNVSLLAKDLATALERLAASGQSLTGTQATSLVDLAATWNTTGTPTAIKLNVTDTASNANSRLFDLQIGGNSRFWVRKDGIVFLSSGGWISQPNGNFVDIGGAGLFPGSSRFRIFNDTLIVSALGGITWNSSAGDVGGTNDLVVTRDAAATLAQRNGVNAQTFRLYNTFTDASNYERGKLEWASNVLRIGTEKAGTGTARALELQTDGTTRVTVPADGSSISVPNLILGVGTNLTIRAASGIVNLEAGGSTYAQFSGGGLYTSNLNLGNSENPRLLREAAGVLAQRSDTNAQTFNIYNTYTSATNYERLSIAATAAGAVRIRTNKGSGGGTARALELGTDDTTRLTVKVDGQTRFIPLTADPANAEDGDVYYNSTTNKLRVRAGGAWVDLH